jgi:hypothetical protein
MVYKFYTIFVSRESGRKDDERKESGWKTNLSIIWNNNQKAKERKLCWAPRKKTFLPNVDGKGAGSIVLVKKTKMPQYTTTIYKLQNV